MFSVLLTNIFPLWLLSVRKLSSSLDIEIYITSWHLKSFLVLLFNSNLALCYNLSWVKFYFSFSWIKIKLNEGRGLWLCVPPTVTQQNRHFLDPFFDFWFCGTPLFSVQLSLFHHSCPTRYSLTYKAFENVYFPILKKWCYLENDVK